MGICVITSKATGTTFFHDYKMGQRFVIALEAKGEKACRDIFACEVPDIATALRMQADYEQKLGIRA